MAERLGGETIAILQEDVFDIPKARPRGSLENFLNDTLNAFRCRIKAVNGPLAAALESRVEKIKVLCEALPDTFRIGSSGNASDAYLRLNKGLHGIHDELVAMSRRHTASVLLGQSWYRMAAWGASRYEHMFHVPFERPQKSYRFSVPGVPAIYLANSVYLCWLECGQPSLNKCVVSRFEVESTGFDFLDLPCSHSAYLAPLEIPRLPGFEPDPRRVMNSPYLNDVVEEVAEYLTVWPLLATVSVRKLDEVPNPPEYIVPQLLMQWVAKQDDLLGIRYFTTKDDSSTNSQDWAVNLALPSRTTRDSGYCEFLAARTRLTAPQPLAGMSEMTLEKLITRAAGGRRQDAGGRYMLRWPDGRIEHYVGTVFGKMEYWLDRSEIELARIRNA
jgi:hypothetical protein